MAADSTPSRSGPFLVAVHVGAGYHSEKLEPQYKAAMKRACEAGAEALRQGEGLLQCAASATSVLEDEPCCNAGCGSNLTEGGAVECDASVMEGGGLFGAVGAARGIGNPVQVAALLAAESLTPMLLGRVRPVFLAGDGARRWAAARGLRTAATEQAAARWHVTPRALQQWQRYVAMLEEAEQQAAAANNSGSDPADLAAGGGTAAAAAAARPSQPKLPPPGEGGGISDGKARGVGRTKRGALQRGAGTRVEGGGTGAARRGSGKRRRREHEGGDGGEQGLEAAGGAAAVIDAAHHPGNDGDGGGGSGGDDGVDDDGSGGPSLAFGDVRDTVGAVCVDERGLVAASVSSGGIALKVDGRVGEAAVYGAGCWAQHGDEATGRPAVAVSVTGVGERVSAALLARTCAAALLDVGRSSGNGADVAARSVEQACCDVISNTVLQGPLPQDCGIVAARVVRSGGRVAAECAAVHCSQSMGAAFYDAGMQAPAAKMLRQQQRGAASARPPSLCTYGRFFEWDVPSH